MSPRTGVPIIALILLALSAAGLRAGGAPPDYQQKDEFRAPGLALPAPIFVLDRKSADVTGDGVADVVFLVGAKEQAEHAYSRETWLVIRDGETEQYATVRPGRLTGGYDGEIFLGDFTGDGLAEILTSLPSGGTGGMVMYSILSYRDHEPTVLFDQERLTRGPQFSVRFRDGFAASVFNREQARTFDLSVGAAKSRYVEAGIYGEDGKLLKKTAGIVNSYSLVQPRDPDGDGVYELVGFQRIWGIYHADTLGIARSVWRWADTEWKLADLRVTTPEAFFAGVYEARLRSPSLPDQLITLALRPDETAQMANDCPDERPAIAKSGTWRRNDDGTITVSLDEQDGRPESESLTLRPRGDLLIATSYDRSAYGSEALTFERDVEASAVALLPSSRPLDSLQTFRGHLVLGPEARVLTACGSEEKIWLSDETGELWEIYQTLVVEPYEPIFVDVQGCLAPPPARGPGRDYARHLLVTRVNRAAREGRGCDEDLRGIEFEARGVEPFWNITISDRGISFFDVSLSQIAFPHVPPAVAPGRWIYYTTLDDPVAQWLLIVIEERRCVDSMSGEHFGFTAEVILDGERYLGCAAQGLPPTD